MKFIDIMELFNIVDNWFETQASPNIKVTTQDNKFYSGQVSFAGAYQPEIKIPPRPTSLYINNKYEIQLTKIHHMEYDGCVYIVQS